MAQEDTLEPTDEPYHDYWTKLGRLIHYHSLVEALVISGIHHFAEVTSGIGNAIAPGLRADGAKSALLRVLETSRNGAIAERLASPLTQFGVINTTRNNLVHWGALRDGDTGFLVTNAKRVIPSSLKEFRVSLRDLDAMHLDLYRIGVHLMCEIRGETLDEWAEVLAGPWLYKPAQRHRPNRPKRSKRSRSSKSPTHPPKSSPP